MKTKNIALFFILSAATSTSFAQTANTPTDCTIQITTAGGLSDFWRGKFDSKVAQLLTAKGYTVVTEGPSTYELAFGGGAGFTCGTGLRWKEAVFRMQTLYSVNLTGPAVKIEKSEYGNSFIVGAGTRAKRKAFEVVRSLPECPLKSTSNE